MGSGTRKRRRESRDLSFNDNRKRDWRWQRRDRSSRCKRLAERQSRDKRSFSDHRDSRSRSVSRSGSSINSEVGHFVGHIGDVLRDRYVVVAEMGKGTFGKVFQCQDLKHKDIVAVKIIRSIERYIDSAKIEGGLLDDIFEQQKRQRSSFCVKLYSRFHLGDHYCMVFEPLGASLYDIIKRNDYKPMPYFVVRAVARQMMEALSFLRNMRLIHTDLKLENVLFVETREQSYDVWSRGSRFQVQLPSKHRIKLIDFGGATYDNDPDKSTTINTRQYRGPEVILEVGWSFPSDLWSAGCIIAELFAGDLLFQTHDELEHLALMERLCGRFPSPMLGAASSSIRDRYFDRNDHVRLNDLPRDSREFVSKTSSIREVFTTQMPPKSSSNTSSSSSSSSSGDGGQVDLESEESLYVAHGLQALVEGMLCIDPFRRLTAAEALTQPVLCDVSLSQSMSTRPSIADLSSQSSRQHGHSSSTR